MQAHMASDEGQAAYSDYKAKQAAYYTGSYVYTTLVGQTGDALFGSLNTLMGNTSRIGNNSFTYNTLRNNYVKVDRDLNASGKVTITTGNDPVLAIEEPKVLPDIICYTTGQNKFCVSNLPEQAQITIFDCAGRPLELRYNCATSETFAAPKGIYFIRIQANNQQRTLKIAN